MYQAPIKVRRIKFHYFSKILLKLTEKIKSRNGLVSVFPRLSRTYFEK